MTVADPEQTLMTSVLDGPDETAERLRLGYPTLKAEPALVARYR